MSDGAEAAKAEKLALVLDQMWARNAPLLLERVALLEQAGLALSAGSRNEGIRRQAHEAAHKLAGVLGTFGLDEGTRLARRAEALLEPGAAGAEKELLAAELRSLAAALRVLIGGRPAQSGKTG